MNFDVINGIFEIVGALFILLNIRRIYLDKQLKGVSWLPTVFFSSWGFWNLFYYPSLNQWYSFAGGILMVATNNFWLEQILYYSAISNNLKRR